MTTVKISEVHDWSNDLSTFSTGFSGKIDTLKTSIDGLANLESFEGNGASSVKNYLKDTHSKLSESFKETVASFSDEVKRSLTDFSSQVDNSSDCVIKKSEIETFKTTVETQYKSMKTSIKTINTEFSNVSSICSVSKIELTEANEAWTELKKIIKTLFEDLQTFENSFSGVLSIFSTQLEGLNQVSQTMGQIGEVGLNNYNAKNFNKLNDIWDKLNLATDGFKLGKGLKFFEKCIKDGSLVLVENSKGQKIWKVTTKKLYDMIKDTKRPWGKNTKFRYISEWNGTLKSGTSGLFEDKFQLPDTHSAYLKPGELKNSVKGIGSATWKGALDEFKPSSFKGLNNLGKGLFIANVGMSAWDNFNDAHNDPSLTTTEANFAGTVNTATDVAIGGATWAGSMATAAAFGTAICPGGGTAAAVAVTAGAIGISMGVNWVLDKTGIKDTVKDIGKGAVKAVSGGLNWAGKKLGSFFN